LTSIAGRSHSRTPRRRQGAPTSTGRLLVSLIVQPKRARRGADLQKAHVSGEPGELSAVNRGRRGSLRVSGQREGRGQIRLVHFLFVTLILHIVVKVLLIIPVLLIVFLLLTLSSPLFVLRNRIRQRTWRGPLQGSEAICKTLQHLKELRFSLLKYTNLRQMCGGLTLETT
jgi:Flp pilus assembly protein TadB